MAQRRGTDASRLSFPLQLVVLIVSTIVTGAVTNYGAQAQIRSDVRDILTRIQLGSEINAERAKSQESAMLALKESNAAIQRRQEMQQIQISQLSEAIAKLTTQGRK